MLDNILAPIINVPKNDFLKFLKIFLKIKIFNKKKPSKGIQKKIFINVNIKNEGEKLN